MRGKHFWLPTEQQITERETRVRLVSTPVTLDGRPAAICGTRQPMAVVATLPNGPVFSWSWKAAERIVANGGDFRS